MVLIGIDPGRTGAIAVIRHNDRKIIDCIEMPMKDDEAGNKSRQSVDFHQLYIMLGKYKDLKPIVIIEKVRAIKGSAAMSTFKFGRNYQSVVDAADVWKYPIRFVEPKKWQAHYFNEGMHKPKIEGRYGKLKTDTKLMALRAAKKIWKHTGTQDEHFYPTYVKKRPPNAKVHDGKVDALLMAYWGLRHILEKGLHPYGTIPVKLEPIFDSEKHVGALDGYVPAL